MHTFLQVANGLLRTLPHRPRPTERQRSRRCVLQRVPDTVGWCCADLFGERCLIALFHARLVGCVAAATSDESEECRERSFGARLTILG